MLMLCVRTRILNWARNTDAFFIICVFRFRLTLYYRIKVLCMQIYIILYKYQLIWGKIACKCLLCITIVNLFVCFFGFNVFYRVNKNRLCQLEADITYFIFNKCVIDYFAIIR